MYTTHEVAKNVFYFAGAYEEPGIGMLPVNFFAVKGDKKTLLVDTGAPPQAKEAMEALSKVLDPASVDYVFLTHMDVDHYGGLKELQKHAPNARLVGNITSMLKGTMWEGISPERFAVVWPGQTIELGNRTLRVQHAFLEDTHTWWLLDETSRTLFSSDAFGSIQFGPPATFFDEAPEGPNSAGFTLWHQVNFSTLAMYDENKYRGALEMLRGLDLQQIGSVHGPFLRKGLDRAFDLLAGVPSAPPPGAPPLPPLFDLR